MKKLLLILLFIPALLTAYEPEYVKKMNLLSAKIKLKDSESSGDWTLVEQSDDEIFLRFKRILDDFPLFARLYKANGALKIDFIAADTKGKVFTEDGYGYMERYSLEDNGYHKLKIFKPDCSDCEVTIISFLVNTIEDEKGETVYFAKNAIRGGYLAIGKEIYNLGNYVTNADVLYAAAYILSPGISWANYAKAAGIPKKILEDPKI